MNLGGIKVSSAEIERVLDTVPGIQRTAAVAINPPGGGPSELVIYAVTDGTRTDRAPLLADLQQAIKTRLNPLFRIADLADGAEPAGHPVEQDHAPRAPRPVPPGLRRADLTLSLSRRRERATDCVSAGGSFVARAVGRREGGAAGRRKRASPADRLPSPVCGRGEG